MAELMFSKTIMMFLHLHSLTSPPQPTVNLNRFTLIGGNYSVILKGTENSQAPVFITRMWFLVSSNSLIKMTRAMAFLRGKDHVTRQESP